MSIVSKSSPVVVKPSAMEMSTCNVVNLSPFDRGLESSPVTFFLMFDRPIHKPAETIQTALSLALVHYYPFAGRLSPGAAGDGDDLSIRCTTADGALFVAASAGCTLEEAKLLEQSPGRRATTLLDELAVDYSAAKGCDRDDPLLLVQVTEFSCGGFVVGVTWNHVVADGAGMAQFLQAIGELARGLSAPSIVPVRCDDSIPSLPPLIAAGRRLMVSMEPQDFANLDVTIPSSFIDRIRAQFHGRSPCTVFEVVTAVLWQCYTRAAISNPDVPSLLCFIADVRKHVGAKDGYYGNCVIGQLVMAPTSGAVANGDLVDLIEMIQHAKEEIPNKLRREEEEDKGGNCLPSTGVSLEQLCDMVRHNNNVLRVSCMRNIGFEDVDFGGGTPAWVTCRSPVMSLPACVPCLPCKGRDGASVLARCVKEEQVDTFVAELAKFT